MLHGNDRTNDKIIIQRFDKNGKNTDDESKATLKNILKNDEKYFYVRVHRDSGKIFNPLKDDIKEQNKNTKNQIFEFVSVNEKCYNKYLEYLKDQKNTDLLRQSNQLLNR